MLLANIGCSKLVDIELPKDQLTTEKVFADSADANAAIVGIYANLGNGSSFITTIPAIYPSMSADDLYQTASNDNSTFSTNTLLNTNSSISGFWTAAYSSIYHINACIEGIEKSTGLNLIQKNNFLSEAKLMRASIYFHLVNLYENIPLIVSTDYNSNKILAQSNKTVVYEQILQDIVDAQNGMTKEFTTVSRVSKAAISALLARVYLYTEQYEKAEVESSKVISSGLFKLVDSPASVFLPASKEIIWAISSVSTSNATGEGFAFIPSSASRIPSYLLTSDLLNSFAPQDLRYKQWIGINNVATIQYYYPYKYKQRQIPSTIDKEKNILLRLAEQYLIRAEAYTQMGKYELAENDINRIRTRAGLLPFKSDGNKEKLLEEVILQRRLELFCEGGHRWYDLKRSNLTTKALLKLKPNWKETAIRYPIPQSQLDKNPYLKQNLGY